MDPKRIESSSVASGTVHEDTIIQKPVQEYGPFPGEVAYPPATFYGHPFPTGHQPFPQIPSYPHVFEVPWGMVHQDTPYFTNDYTKVNVDVDSSDGGARESADNQEQFDSDSRLIYPVPFYGAPFLYPRPFFYGYPAPIYYPRPFIYPPFII
jgi:hypothetical protein